MARPRKHNKHLPRGLLQRRGTYFFVRSDQPWRNLGKDYGKALIEYASLVGESPRIETINQAVTQYLQDSAGRLKPATLVNYGYSARNLEAEFGPMRLDELQPEHVFHYLRTRGTVMANRDKALLSASYSFARRSGAFKGVDPTKGLQFRNKEKPRDRYVEDGELAMILSAASPKLACIARFAFLTGMRQSDALRVRLSDIDDEGIHYRSGKTDKALVVLWSPELRECVDEAQRLWIRVGREHLFESKPKGQHKRPPGPYTPSGLRALWRVARARVGLQDVTLHDLRRKAGSDLEPGEAQRLLGHTDGKVTARHYRAKADRVKPVR